METTVAEPNILEESVPANESEEKAQQNVSSGDLEGAYHLDNLDPVSASAEVASLGYLSFSNIINQIWHFCSVDYGPKCITYLSAFKDDTDQDLQTHVLDTTPFILSKSTARSWKTGRVYLRAKDYGAGLYYVMTVC
jgi:hypothetical protein